MRYPVIIALVQKMFRLPKVDNADRALLCNTVVQKSRNFIRFFFKISFFFVVYRI